MKILILWASTVLVSMAGADTIIPVQGRVFLANTKISPTELNNGQTALGLKKFEVLQSYGAEITYPIVDFLNIGFRYSHKDSKQDEDPSNDATDYYSSITQDAVIFLGRVPIVRSTYFWLDFFVGGGGVNTDIKLKVSGVEGEFSKKAEGAWFATPTFSYGGSFGVGYKWVFLMAEAGYESTKVDGFKRSGSVTGDLDPVDLSGPYFMISLMFNGVPGKIK